MSFRTQQNLGQTNNRGEPMGVNEHDCFEGEQNQIMMSKEEHLAFSLAALRRRPKCLQGKKQNEKRLP